MCMTLCAQTNCSYTLFEFYLFMVHFLFLTSNDVKPVEPVYSDNSKQHLFLISHIQSSSVWGGPFKPPYLPDNFLICIYAALLCCLLLPLLTVLFLDAAAL